MSDYTTVEAVTVTAARDTLRLVRARVFIDGEIVVPMAGKITRTNDFQADTFSLDFALSADRTKDLAWWMDRQGMEIQIEVGLEKDGFVDWQPSLAGIADRVSINVRGTVTVTGRDKVALFDRKTAKTFKNQTASEAVAEMAKDKGMTADVQATKGKIGSEYDSDNLHHSIGAGRAVKEWDLIVELAKKEGFSVWVEGNVLHFKDVAEDAEVRYLKFSPNVVTDGLGITGESWAEDINITHDFNAAKDIKVVVKSHHTRLGVDYVKSAKSKAGRTFTAGGGAGHDETQVYTYYRPNLTAEQAQDYANQRHAELTHGEYVVEWVAPCDLTLTPRAVLNFDEPPAPFLDTDFFIEEVSFEFGFGRPFIMHVRAKTTPPPSETGVEQ